LLSETKPPIGAFAILLVEVLVLTIEFVFLLENVNDKEASPIISRDTIIFVFIVVFI
jgi:hypothetical protein